MKEIIYKCQDCGRHYVVTAHMGDARYCPDCKKKRAEAESESLDNERDNTR